MRLKMWAVALTLADGRCKPQVDSRGALACTRSPSPVTVRRVCPAPFGSLLLLCSYILPRLWHLARKCIRTQHITRISYAYFDNDKAQS